MFEKKEHQNSGTLGKDTINSWIITFLSVKKEDLALIMESNQMFIFLM